MTAISRHPWPPRADELAARRSRSCTPRWSAPSIPPAPTPGTPPWCCPTATIQGFVGGNCVEASVREYSLQVLASQEPLLLRVVPGEPSRTAEEGAVKVSNPCLSGGAIEIFLAAADAGAPGARGRAHPVAQALATLGAGVGLDVGTHRRRISRRRGRRRGADRRLARPGGGSRPRGGAARRRPLRRARGQRDAGRRGAGIPRRRRRRCGHACSRPAGLRAGRPDPGGNRAVDPGPAGLGTRASVPRQARRPRAAAADTSAARRG